MVWQAGPGLATTQGVMAVAQALLPLVTLLALKRAVDAAAAAVGKGATGSVRLLEIFKESEVRLVAFWFLVGAVAMALQALLRAMASWFAEQHAMAVNDLVHARLHDKLTAVDLAFFEDSTQQDRLHLVQSQAVTQPVRVLGSLFHTLHAVVALLGIMGLLATIHPLVPLLLLLSGTPILLLRIRRGRRLFAWRQEQAPLEREASYFHRLLSSGNSAQELRLHGHVDFLRQRFASVRLRLRQARLWWRRYLLTRELAVQTIMLLTLGLVLFWLTGQLFQGALTLGGLVMAVQALQRGQAQVGGLATACGEIYQSALFFSSFEELLALPLQVVAPAVAQPVPRPLRQGIVFEGVSFVYPGTERRVLEGVSFTLHKGERLALAGPNGAGKSTLIKLLCRLYDPTEGRILADGVDIRNFDPAAWRRLIGVLFQDFGRYQLTAGENIWLGDPHGTPADPRVAAAARQAGLERLYASWPQGLETQLGRWLRPGVEPSVGQWQRLALARALLRPAELLVLDEPSSALDTATQSELITLLKESTIERSTLIVSHRREMLDWADRVIRVG